MKDFLDKAKTIFFMQTDHLSNNEITTLINGIMKPKPVDLSYYAENHIPNYRSITEIPQENLNYLNSGLVASDMGAMFSGCNNLKTVPKLNIDTFQCTNMSGMFYTCQALTTIDLSNWNTSKVTSMSNMFHNCNSLTSLDLSNFDTSNVTSMDNMFNYCQALTTLDLSNWNTSNVTDMRYIFGSCNSLTSLDLSNFNTSKVTNMNRMFSNCRNLEHIEGIIDMKSCIGYRYKFYGCYKLSGVKIKNPPQAYYDSKTQFESDICLTSDQYEIVS